MSRIYSQRSTLPPEPGRSGKRPKAPRRRERADVPRPEPRRRHEPSEGGQMRADSREAASAGDAS